MNFRERKERLDYLLEMVEKGQCVSLIQVAEKYNCSTRTVKRMIAELKEYGHQIEYCSCLKKFQKK